MSFSLFIARRYLFSKKSHSAINLISAISATVVAFVTLAMVVVLSAFNGIESLVEKLYSTIDADIVISPAKGKTMEWPEILSTKIAKLPAYQYSSKVIQDEVLIRYNGKQTVATLKGVDQHYKQVSNLDSTIIDGNPSFYYREIPQAIMGAGLHYQLEMPPVAEILSPLEIFALPKGNSLSRDKTQAFQQNQINVGARFSINADYDTKYVFVPFEYAKNCFNYQDELSSIEIKLKGNADQQIAKKELQDILGKDFTVSSRADKNALAFQTSKTEKWFTFLILIFILLIAAFNILASLTMLIIDKKKDIKTLTAMGLHKLDLTKIFFYQSLLINGVGTFVGLVLGLGFCFLQQYFGLIALEGSVVSYYPIEVKAIDILAIIAVMLLVSLASYFGVSYLINRHSLNK